MPQDQEHQDEAARSSYVPGSIPRNCVSCYRGYLARMPRTITRRNGGMTVCRMGVNMASSKSTQEEVEELTEWVDITAFREHADRLARMTVGEMIVIMGPVSVHFYTSKGRTRICRTIVAVHNARRSEHARSRPEPRRPPDYGTSNPSTSSQRPHQQTRQESTREKREATGAERPENRCAETARDREVRKAAR